MLVLLDGKTPVSLNFCLYRIISCGYPKELYKFHRYTVVVVLKHFSNFKDEFELPNSMFFRYLQLGTQFGTSTPNREQLYLLDVVFGLEFYLYILLLSSKTDCCKVEAVELLCS